MKKCGKSAKTQSGKKQSGKKGEDKDACDWLYKGAAGEPTEETFENVYLVNARRCRPEKHRGNCYDNPLCFQGFGGIGPGSDCEFDTGIAKPLMELLRSFPEARKLLDYDAEVEGEGKSDKNETERAAVRKYNMVKNHLFRESLEVPVGIANEGATCYMNSFLQFLYNVPEFRSAVFQVATDHVARDEEKIVEALYRLFAQQNASLKKVLHATDLVRALEIDPKVQQDAQEFSNLFLDLLDREFANSSVESVRTVIKNLFWGRNYFVNECNECHNVKKKKTDYREISIFVGKSRSSLEKGVEGMLKPEVMKDDNMHFCEKCQKKTETLLTTVYIEKALPPYLTIRLSRFQYDVKTLSRTKVRTEYSFPMVFDGSCLLTSEKKGQHMYQLHTVIVHKGMSAMGGHYVTYSRNPNGKWYLYDDSIVTDVTEDIRSVSTSGSFYSRNPLLNLWLKDASILVYERMESKNEYPDVPAELLDSVIRENEEYATFKSKCEEIISHRKEALKSRRALVSNIRELMKTTPSTVDMLTMSCISSNWFDRFLHFEDCGAITNEDVLCLHAKLAPDCCTKMKLVPKAVYDLISDSVGSKGPECTLMCDFCKECLSEYCSTKVSLREKIMEVNNVKEELKRGCYVAGDSTDLTEEKKANGYWISKDWVQAWMKRKSDVSPLEVTSTIVCEHGRLGTDAKSRVLVEERIWNVIQGQMPDDLRDSVLVFKGTDECCPECMARDKERERALEVIRRDHDEIKSLLKDHQPSVYNSKLRGDYFLVDAQWFSRLKKWLSDPNPQESVPLMDNDSLICEHGLFPYNPDDLNTCSGGKYLLFPALKWFALVKLCGAKKCNEVVVKLSKDNDVEPKFSVDTCWDCYIARTDTSTKKEEPPKKETEPPKKSSEPLHVSKNGAVIKIVPGVFKSPEDVCSDVIAWENEGKEGKKPTPKKGKKKTAWSRMEIKTINLPFLDPSWTAEGLKMSLYGNFCDSYDLPFVTSQVIVFDGKIVSGDAVLSSFGITNNNPTLYFGELSENVSCSSETKEYLSGPPSEQEVGFKGSKLVK